MLTTEAARTVRLWYPFTSTFADATESVEFKAPEEGNTEKRARNQSIVRTRAGNLQVYDRGNNFNTVFKLEFKDLTDVERSAIVLFLDAIQWGTSKIVYQDMYGTQYIVRVVAEDGIEWIDRGLNKKRGKSFIHWDFNLELLNLTDNPGDLETVDPVPSSALLLHLTDYDDPHNPTVINEVDNAEVDVVLAQTKTTEWRQVLYTVLVWKAGDSASYLVAVSSNRVDMSTVATTTDIDIDVILEHGTVASHITFTATLSGIGADQMLNLIVNTDADDWKFEVRKLKLGSQANLYG